jgi:bifunctional non-homologous end joining protein LigD
VAVARSALSNRVCPHLPSDRRPDQTGFTRSSTTASASWPAATAPACITRNGNDFIARFPLAAAAVAALPGHSFLIDGEAIVTDESGLAVFELVRRARNGSKAVLCAFDLIELNGQDLRRWAIEQRKAKLTKLISASHPGIVLNEHYDGDGAMIFKQACTLGCEGIVSKRLGSHYRSGRADCWVKVKNPAAPAIKREAEEDWGR